VVGLFVRLIVSLALVVGLLLLLARVAQGRYRGRSGAAIQVLHRQALGKGSSVAVVSVGGRVLVVGATDNQVSLLTELDPDELQLEVNVRAAEGGEPGDDELAQVTKLGQSPLAGSLLSPQTWRQAWQAVRGGNRRAS